MSIQDQTPRDGVGFYDGAEFAYNPEPRCSIVLVLDVSGAMAMSGNRFDGDRIDTVNRALAKFSDIIRGNPVTALRADVAIIAFDDVAWVLQDFTNGAYFEAPFLEVHVRGTNFPKTINLALDLIEARKQSYRDGGIDYYRSLVYFLISGHFAALFPNFDDLDSPTKVEQFVRFYAPVDPAEVEQAVRRLAAAEENRSVAFFPFIIGNAFGDGIPSFFPLLEEMEERSNGHFIFSGYSGFSAEELREYGVAISGRRLDLGRLAELTGETVPELMERCVMEGVMRIGIDVLSKLVPRRPIELTNMAQLEGSIVWLARSVEAVSQSQPGDSLRLPQLDFLDV